MALIFGNLLTHIMTNSVKSIQEAPRVRLQLTMYFAYQGQQRSDYAAYRTTFEAAKAGKRTSTLRKKEWYQKAPWHYQALLKLQQGDYLLIWSGKKVGEGECLLVRLLQKPEELQRDLTDEMLEELSQLEGWTVDYLKANGYQRPVLGLVQLRYTPVDGMASEIKTKKQDDNSTCFPILSTPYQT